MASKEDVTDVLALYTEFFNSPGTSESVSLINQQPTPGLHLGKSVRGGDPGIDIEGTLSPQEISKNLGFQQGLPLPFNTHRHRGGVSAWDRPDLFEPTSMAQDPEMEPIVLHWHQLAGVHAIIRMLFTKEPSLGKVCGVLIADEVGLGKTFQAATVVAFLSDLTFRQHMRKHKSQIIPNPPLIGKSRLLYHLEQLITLCRNTSIFWRRQDAPHSPPPYYCPRNAPIPVGDGAEDSFQSQMFQDPFVWNGKGRPRKLLVTRRAFLQLERGAFIKHSDYCITLCES